MVFQIFFKIIAESQGRKVAGAQGNRVTEFLRPVTADF
jgi:hypothetical protein